MNSWIIAPAVTVILMAGCASAVRYSPEEIKDYPPVVQEHIRNGSITTGMTHHQVRFSWGAPASVTVIAPSDDGKMREEWVYSRLGVFRTRLIFTDGRLTEIFSSEPGIAK